MDKSQYTLDMISLVNEYWKKVLARFYIITKNLWKSESDPFLIRDPDPIKITGSTALIIMYVSGMIFTLDGNPDIGAHVEAISAFWSV